MKKNKAMSPTEFENRMMAIVDEWGADEEVCHIEMDALMMQVLEQLGYGKGVDIFGSAKKWYA